jgi:coenzyme PQQ synthesis protein D (PqqD)
MPDRPIGPRAAGVLETEIDGDLSLYLPKSETVAVLNATASDVWRLCDGDLTIADVVAALAKAYGVAEASIAEEVVRVVADLTEKGFLAGPDQDQ